MEHTGVVVAELGRFDISANVSGVVTSIDTSIVSILCLCIVIISEIISSVDRVVLGIGADCVRLLARKRGVIGVCTNCDALRNNAGATPRAIIVDSSTCSV